jgi:hypothetical protein
MSHARPPEPSTGSLFATRVEEAMTTTRAAKGFAGSASNRGRAPANALRTRPRAGAALPLATGCLLVAFAATDPAEAQVGFEGISVFATNSVWVKQNADVVSGSVVVNDASPGPTLVAGFELAIGLSVTTSAGTNLVADSIDVRSGAVVLGELFCNEIDDGTGALGCDRALDLPVFLQLPPFQFAPAGASDVTVPIGDSAVLAPGSYRDVKVRQNGTLVLTGGVYDLRNLEVGLSADLVFEAPSRVRIADKLEVTQNAFVGPTTGAAFGARDIVLYVAGINGSSGNLGADPKAAKLGIDAVVHANVYAPNGTLWIRDGSVVTGAFLGRDVIVGLSAEVHLDSAFGNQAPIANPQDVVTNGPGTITITLTGFDPDGDDLVFDIVDGPTEGTLGPLQQAPAPFPGDPVGCKPEDDPLCVPPDPARTSATVDYTPATGDDLEDSFTFRVEDPDGATGVAVVRINPGADNPPPDAPVDTVVAFDAGAETAENIAVEVSLSAEAPCDGACDGEGADGDSSLTFSIPAGGEPEHGTLGAVVQGSEVPQRSATVSYTPDTDFSGADSFQFEACGLVGGVTTCDSATVTVAVVGGLAEDVTATTEQNVATTITLLGTPGSGGAGATLARERTSLLDPMRRTVAPRRRVQSAVALFPAQIAGNVADADADGFGDNHNALPGAAPVLMSAGVQQSGGAGSNGTVRMQVEWDLAEIGCPESASVFLTTNRGSVDFLPTMFFAGTGVQDGELSDSDFEAPAEPIFDDEGFLVSMPVSGDLGVDGSFGFTVTEELHAALRAGLDHFSVSGRVDETFGSPGRGLQVYTTADGAVADQKQPQLSVATPPIGALVFQVDTLPTGGTLTDICGNAITTVPFTLATRQVRFVPDPTFFGTTTFQYSGIDFTGSTSAIVTIVVNGFACEENGREPGCSPGG